MIPTVEVRVPTYRRARMLERALVSLQAQSLESWTALVMDDSKDREGQTVVERLKDSRIKYLPNATRLGCAGNLDQAFETRSIAAAKFACVLEDDNWFRPEFLAANIDVLSAGGASILLRNQEVFEDSGEGAAIPADTTTRGGVFEEGLLSVLRLRASMFLCEGVSNGGLFWSTDARSSLRVGSAVAFASLQEYCRTLMVNEPIYFAAEPLAAFSRTLVSSRESLSGRSFNCARQSIWRRLVRVHRGELVAEALSLARTPQMKATLYSAMADVFVLPTRLPTVAFLMQAAKGLAKLALVPNPLAEFWRARGDTELRCAGRARLW